MISAATTERTQSLDLRQRTHGRPRAGQATAPVIAGMRYNSPMRHHSDPPIDVVPLPAMLAWNWDLQSRGHPADDASYLGMPQMIEVQRRLDEPQPASVPLARIADHYLKPTFPQPQPSVILVHPGAARDLDAICAYLEAIAPDAAGSSIAILAALTPSPSMGQPGPAAGTRELDLGDSHRIIYRVDPALPAIDVVAIAQVTGDAER